MPQTLPRELKFFLNFFANFLLQMLPISDISYNFATSNEMFNKHYNAMITEVIFSVGEKHPLYNKPVRAEIISTECGYDKRQVYAKTVKPVHYPEDKHGLLCYDANNHFKGFKTRPAYNAIHEGYCKIVK